MALCEGLILTFVAVFSAWFLLRRRRRNKLRVLVEGVVDPRFEKVAQVFRKNFESGAETGAAFAVYYKGDLVVDLWGGYINKEGHIPWRENNMSIAFSTSKGINALLLAKFVELGYLDYKKLVSHYWPEFAQNGKENITVEMLVSHQAGLIAFDKPLSLYSLKTDYEKYLQMLETQKPFWEPGTNFGYHIFTWGCYVDALLMKADPKKRTTDQIFRDEIGDPFGIDFYQGVPTSEQYRIATRLYYQSLGPQLHLLFDKDFRRRIIYSIRDPNGYQKVARMACKEFLARKPNEKLSDSVLRGVPLSSLNGYGTARGIAKLFGIISNGGVHDKKTLLTESTIKTLDQVIVEGHDSVMDTPLKLGRGLFINDSPAGSKMFGHPGYGGQMGAGDLQNKVGLSYVTNNLGSLAVVDPRYLGVRDAFYECLAKIQNDESSKQ